MGPNELMDGGHLEDGGHLTDGGRVIKPVDSTDLGVPLEDVDATQRIIQGLLTGFPCGE